LQHSFHAPPLPYSPPPITNTSKEKTLELVKSNQTTVVAGLFTPLPLKVANNALESSKNLKNIL
jgi:hypothetical protein